jgi:hypothetical protein
LLFAATSQEASHVFSYFFQPGPETEQGVKIYIRERKRERKGETERKRERGRVIAHKIEKRETELESIG